MGVKSHETKKRRRYADLWSRPGYLVRRLHQIHGGLFFEECRAFELTPVQFALLTILAGGQALDQVSLSNAVGIDRTSGADVIRRLIRRGLIERVPSETDRRAKLARITPDGRRFVESMHPYMELAQERLLAPLDPEERAAFMALLNKLIRANNDASRAPPPPGF